MIRQSISLLRQHANVVSRANSEKGCVVTNSTGSANYASELQEKLDECLADLRQEAVPRVQPAPNPPTSSTPTVVPTQQRPQSTAPSQVTQRDEKCSDVSGTGGPRIACPPSAKFGFSCGTGTDCAAQAKWIPYEPYNHSKTPVTFHQFRGAAIVIKEGETLWSIPDETSPTRRRLEALPWDKVSTFPLMQHKCSQEQTTATNKPFVVRIECEIERQGDLQKKFETREDSNTLYMDTGSCKSPWTLSLKPGWEKLPASYWKENPDEPVGWCLGPMRNNRQDSKRVREPKWHTEAECSSEHLISLPMGISRRGVRGCKFKGE